MNWLTKAYKKNQQNTSESEISWAEGYRAYDKGQGLYSKRQTNEALYCLDKAIENGFEEGDVFFLRAMCLQELKYDYDAISDFDKAISISPKDCNLYYLRSVSQGAVGNFQGEIADIESAIELSKEDSELNQAYNDRSKKMGYKNVASMYEFYLLNARSSLQMEKEENERILNSEPEEWKAYLVEMKNSRKKIIKRRGE
jgi:tetratricopeptide (TPR) repeat protein